MTTDEARPKKTRRRLTVGGLMVVVAGVAVGTASFRPMTREEAIRLAIASAQSLADGPRAPGDRLPSDRMSLSRFEQRAWRGEEGWVVELVEDGGPYGYHCEVIDHEVMRTGYGRFWVHGITDPSAGPHSWGLITPPISR